MKPARIRRLVHDTNATAALVLLLSGILISYPDLRAMLLGGYGNQLSDIHIWAGWTFAVVPLLGFFYKRKEIAANLQRRLRSGRKNMLRRAHLAGSLLCGTIFAITGIVMWWETGVPLIVLDSMLEVHIWLAWLMGATLLAHIYSARRGIIGRTRQFFRKLKPARSASPATRPAFALSKVAATTRRD